MDDGSTYVTYVVVIILVTVFVGLIGGVFGIFPLEDPHKQPSAEKYVYEINIYIIEQ